MNTPDRSGEALRAIAQSYRDEIGSARAEQLVSRAMARASARPSHSKAIRLLAPSLALAAGVLAVGLVLIVGNSDSGSQVSDPQPPVASGTAPDAVISEGPTAGVPTISKERLMEALDLIDQQKELQAAEVVVSALAAMPGSAGTGGTTEDVSSPPTTVAEAGGTPTTSTTVRGAVPPEQGTYPGGESSTDLHPPLIHQKMTERIPNRAQRFRSPLYPIRSPPLRNSAKFSGSKWRNSCRRIPRNLPRLLKTQESQQRPSSNTMTSRVSSCRPTMMKMTLVVGRTEDEAAPKDGFRSPDTEVITRT